MKFIKKHAFIIIIAIIVILFVLLAILTKDNKTEKVNEVDRWLEDTKNGYVVSVYAQTTCGHCKNFKPVMEEVQEENGFNLYWFELDTLKEADLNKVLNTYEMTGYKGTPYTLITNNGEVVSYKSGETTKEALVEILTDAGVINN